MKKLTFLCLLFAGCATTGNYQRRLDTYLGISNIELADNLGYPTRTFIGPNGNLVYAYENVVQYTQPTFHMPGTSNTTGFVYPTGTGYSANTITTPGASFGGGPTTRWCNTYFELNSSNVVVYWRWQGNGCFE